MVVVGGPSRDYLQPEADAIKNFVEKGGRAIVMMDPPLRFAKETIDDNAALAGVAIGWGVSLDKDLVLDTSGAGQVYGLGPEIALVGNYSSHPIVREMKRMAAGFPVTRSLTIKSGDNATVEKLFETSEDAIATTNLASSEIRPSASDKKGPFVLGAAGTFKTGGGEGGAGRFVVTGSSSWASNAYLRIGGNRDLFLNMLNWLSADEDLISIRPKEPEDRRLNMNRNQMALVFYSSVLGIPLLILAAGISVWWKRR